MTGRVAFLSRQQRTLWVSCRLEMINRNTAHVFWQRNHMVTIYLSSTYEDLEKHRRTVFDALRKSGYQVIAMEDYVATDQRPVDQCLADVGKSDLYVGLFAFRYGDIPPAGHNNPDGLSITELEFRHAQKLGKPCLIFMADWDALISRKFDDPWTGVAENGDRIKKLRDELDTECLASFFKRPDELASLVQAAVTKKLDELKLSPESSKSEPDITWDIEKNGSPFPGLLHFNRKFASVFFGRETEVDEVLDRLYSPDGRFIIISGDSGTGKSSFVDAGILPQLEKAGLPDGKRYLCLRMRPTQGTDPFKSLADHLQSFAIQAGRNPDDVDKNLRAGPKEFAREVQAIVKDGMDADELVLFLDQTEELFKLRGKTENQESTYTFLSSLDHAVRKISLRVIATLRSDFLPDFYKNPKTLEIIKRRDANYPLGGMPPRVLAAAIENPARCAGLTIEAPLIDRIIQDVGNKPGNLPLLAFALEHLFDKREGNSLTERAYDEFNGVQGAIKTHIEKTEQELIKERENPKLKDPKLEQLKCLFKALLIVNPEGKPSRRFFLKTGLNSDLQTLADYLVEKRILSTGGKDEKSTLSFSHEILFEAWPTLCNWIKDNQGALIMLRKAEHQARDWENSGYALKYLWTTDILKELQKAIEDLKPGGILSSIRQYAEPQEKLVESLKKEALSHEERSEIGTRLAELGEKRGGVRLASDDLPFVIDWIGIGGGQITLDEEECARNIADFQIARYPVTHGQFQEFIKADGYTNALWWEGLKKIDIYQKKYQKKKLPPQKTNCPCENVSWYEAVAFCRWLTKEYRDWGIMGDWREIRLPTEWEWQQAATNGNPENEYPWGAAWNESNCNNFKAGLGGTVAVGMYPNGTWPDGPLDMCGNVWEWCQRKGDDPIPPGNKPIRVRIRGGSWDDGELCSSSTYCYRTYLTNRGNPRVGFRLVKVK